MQLNFVLKKKSYYSINNCIPDHFDFCLRAHSLALVTIQQNRGTTTLLVVFVLYILMPDHWGLHL